MATLANPFGGDDDKDKQKEGQQDLTPPSVISGESANVSASPTAPGQQGPSNSGRFANLQNYINANKGYHAERGGLGGQIASNINKAGQNVQQNVGAANQQFTQESSAAAQPWKDESIQVNPAQPQPAQASQPVQAQATSAQPNILQRVQTDASALGRDEASKVKAMRDASYQGPNSLLDLKGDKSLGALQVQAQNVSSMVNQAGNESGRFNLLRQMFNKQGYGSGQQKLDNLIVQGQKDQLNTLQGSRKAAVDTNRNIDESQQAAQAQAQGLNSLADATKTQTRQAINQGALNAAGNVNKELERAKNDQDVASRRLAAGMSGYSLNKDDLASLGLNEGENFLDAFDDPNNIDRVLKRVASPTAQNVATAQDYARISALKDLAGQAAKRGRFSHL
jgi:hypothetical protein